MPRKQSPVLERKIQLPFGRLELTVVSNPLEMSVQDRVKMNSVLDQLDVIEKTMNADLTTTPAAPPAAGDDSTKH